ncbi:MAG: 50S ribosomal protein L22 [Candidatus Micrarchaeia archaeon]
MYKYSAKVGEKDACAQGHDWDASYKDLVNIARAIKNKDVAKARIVLDEAIALKHAIRYTKHNTGCGHRSELGGRKGRYPMKECRLVRKLLENAVANATGKGMDESKLMVKSARAFKQNEFPRYRRFWVGSVTLGYGRRAVWANYITSRMEIVVSEKK